MPSYVAFLRAINLGAKRKFPKDAIKAAVEAAGGTEVETYINTGNVRLDSRLRSQARVATALEDAFLADRGFEVPTIVFTPKELVEIGELAQELSAQHPDAAAHYITLFKEPPTSAATKTLGEVELDGELCRVEGRAAHVVMVRSFHETRLQNSKQFTALGVGTARNATVIRKLVEKWGS